MNRQLIWRALLVLAVLGGACSSSSFIDEITFINETDYPAHVEVSDASRQGWLDLTVAQRDRETIVQEVIDQGNVWVFRFDYVGKHVEELEISSEELMRSNWTVQVPNTFGDALHRMGVEPPP